MLRTCNSTLPLQVRLRWTNNAHPIGVIVLLLECAQKHPGCGGKNLDCGAQHGAFDRACNIYRCDMRCRCGSCDMVVVT